MKNEKIITFPKQTKRQLRLTGYPVYPLHVGERAWIMYGNGGLITTSILRILEASFDCLVFETQNTIYQLSNTPIPHKDREEIA